MKANPARIPSGRSFMKRTAVVALLLAQLAASRAATNDPVSWLPGETAAQREQRMAWWHEAKFGMFIHWGIYCIPADGEWHMRKLQQPFAEYSKFAAEFNPVKFNADEWMGLAHDAGMKYVVITTKHHDGFAMFKSGASAYNVVDATPFKRDVVKELSEACPKHDIRFGTYYSFLADWGHKGGGAGCPHWDTAFQDGDLHDYIKTVAMPQLKELLTNYGKLGEFWFDSDGAHGINPEESAQVVEILKTQPQLIVDPRLAGVKGDFDTAEQHMPLRRPKRDWELCGTVNGAWGYTNARAKPIEKLLPYMITAWGMGGNVLMNVGPTRDGIIPEDSAERLREVGNWMKINGESIYGSTGGPFTWLPWGTATRKGDFLYLQVFHWPGDGVLKVPLSNKATKAWMLADPDKKALSLESKDDRILVHVPAKGTDPVVSVVVLKIEGEPVCSYTSLALNKPVTASSSQESARALNDDDGGSRWRNTNTTGSVEIDLGKPQTFTTLRIAPCEDMKSYTLEAKVGDAWQPVLQGKSLRRDENIETFPPVTAQVVRFSFKDEPKPPQICDFELYPPL
jgi:alpha-L-fucosidase